MKLTLLTLVLALLALTNGRQIEPFADPDFTNTLKLTNGFDVTWAVYNGNKSVVFEVISNTVGWVGFGISASGNMNGADLIMGGVNPDKTTYFSDRFATAAGPPTEDLSQDWKLIDAKDDGVKTTLRFWRLFDTGDAGEDYKIEDKNTKFIWSQGPDDNMNNPHVNKGQSGDVNILKDQAGTTTTTPATTTAGSSSIVFSVGLLTIMQVVARY